MTPRPGSSMPFVLPLVLAVAALVAAARPVAAAQGAADVVWTRYDVSLDLRDDGSLRVVERQEVEFGASTFRRAFAEIPLGRVEEIRRVVVREETANGVVTFRHEPDRLGFHAAPAPGTFRWQRDGDVVAIDWGFEPAFGERRVFFLEYDAVGALRVYPNPPPPAEPNQQLWWTTIGRQVTEIAPVRAATVTVRLPRPVDPARAVVAFNDEVGDPAAVTADGQTWRWEAGDLATGEEMTVRLQFPPLVQAAPPAWQAADDARVAQEEAAEAARLEREQAAADRRDLINTMLLGAGMLAVVAGGVGVYGLWYARGRDPHAGVVAGFLAEPPDNLPPGAAGALLDEVVHQRDVVATLADLARRGVVAMRDVRDGYGIDTKLTLLRTDATLSRFERALLESLFGFNHAPGETVRLWEVSSRFAAAGPELRRLLYAELVERGYFAASPEETRQTWRDRALKAFLVLVIGGGAAGAVFARDLGWYWFPITVGALLAVAVYLVSGALPRKSAAGVEAAARWQAFRRYLEEIERYEKVDEATERFERYLPYAVAFGLERSWVEAFAQADTPAPSWYGFSRDAADADPDPSLADWLRRRDPTDDGAATRSRSWWDVADAWDRGDRGDRGEGGGGWGAGGRDDGPGWSLPDWQGTSDHAGRALQGAGNGLLSMFNGAGRALSAIAEAAASSSDDDGWGGSSWSSSCSSSSSSRSSGSRGFGGGGHRGGSSGGGRRGFG
ncbi:MAG: DUF2207 domain-containing protein [Chloroflexota bacterium]|nr:DUF2207 domain-containing protein [Chloroflexota bacterium]